MNSLTMKSEDILEVNELANKLFDVGYNRGYQDCYKNLSNTSNHSVDYGRGLKDAYECMLRIICSEHADGMTSDELLAFFGDIGRINVLKMTTPENIVKKVRKWEKETEEKRKPTIANCLRLLKEGDYAKTQEMLEALQSECSQPCEKKQSSDELSFF